MDGAVIRARGLNAGCGGEWALRGVDFEAAAGEYVGVVGPNGSGKTTFLRALLGLADREGEVELFGTAPERFREWGRVGYVPQAARLPYRRFPASVREVVEAGRLPRLGWSRRLGKKDRAAVEAAMTAAGLEGFEGRMVGELSGGELQRVSLARALAGEPELLMLDEPTSALDPARRSGFYDLLAKLNGERGVTILLVTHDSATIGTHATRLLYLDGRVIFDGSFAAFCESPEMTAYFGRATQHQVCGMHVPRHGAEGHTGCCGCGAAGEAAGHGHAHGHGGEEARR